MPSSHWSSGTYDVLMSPLTGMPLNRRRVRQCRKWERRKPQLKPIRSDVRHLNRFPACGTKREQGAVDQIASQIASVTAPTGMNGESLTPVTRPRRVTGRQNKENKRKHQLQEETSVTDASRHRLEVRTGIKAGARRKRESLCIQKHRRRPKTNVDTREEPRS